MITAPPVTQLIADFPLRLPLLANLVPANINLWIGGGGVPKMTPGKAVAAAGCVVSLHVPLVLYALLCCCSSRVVFLFLILMMILRAMLIFRLQGSDWIVVQWSASRLP